MTDTDDTVLVHQPMVTAPRDGTPVRLVMQANGVKWRTPTLFSWQHGRWRAVVSGIPVSGSADVVGWERVDADA